MFNKNETELKELAELCKPIARFIASKNDSGTDCYSVNITEGTFEMVKIELYAPMKIEIEETAQEVQEQYEGKCEHCGYDNEFKSSTPLPKGIYPKFCMKCGKDVKFIKKDIH